MEEILKEPDVDQNPSGSNSKFTTFAEVFDLDDVKVFNPKMTSQGHMTYTFNGFDKAGGFRNVDKRYSEFFDFYQWIKDRYQGLFVPVFPPKKMFGNKDAKFIEERRTHLQQFLRDFMKEDYLRESDELKAFVRVVGANRDLIAELKNKQR